MGRTRRRRGRHFPPGYHHDKINDSKQLSEKERDSLYDVIMKDAIAIGVGQVEAAVIDKVNILQATKTAMRQALGQLNIKPDFVMFDAIHLDDFKTPQLSLIKGDALALPIAAASIIAKVTRDRLMHQLRQRYPEYRFDLHKGYGTALHAAMIEKYGPIKGVHRFTYKPLKKYLLR
ncbi:MAG: ribonuclease HII [Rhodopseudomonas palustris]|nr:ribonuclease HII [Rhodopseudomonas palustris]